MLHTNKITCDKNIKYNLQYSEHIQHYLTPTSKNWHQNNVMSHNITKIQFSLKHQQYTADSAKETLDCIGEGSFQSSCHYCQPINSFYEKKFHKLWCSVNQLINICRLLQTLDIDSMKQSSKSSNVQILANDKLVSRSDNASTWDARTHAKTNGKKR